MTIRIARIASLILAMVFVLVVTLVLVIDLGRFKPQIESLVTDALEREFVITGPLNIDLGGTIMVAAEGIQLEGSQWGVDPLVTIGRLVVAIDSGSLFDDMVVVDWLEIEGLAVVLEENAAGEDNWTFPSTADSAPTVDGPEDRTVLPALVREARLADFSLQYRSPALAAPLQIVTGMTELRADDPEGLSLSTAGLINETPFRISARAGDLAGLIELGSLQLVADGELGEVSFNGSAAVSDAQNPSRATSLTIDAERYDSCPSGMRKMNSISG